MASQDQAKSAPPLTDSAHHPTGTLSGQQIQALQKQLTDKMAGIVKDVDLRKWSVDQACGIASAAMEAEHGMIEVVVLARTIHKFLTEGTSQTT
jgi:hypothetical protein